tara:strand:+ start:99 stop:851 length:753 start_codon:yes stop_codon:yes gene_type:complete
MIKSKILRNQKYISHYFFNRLGGTSKGIYTSLNCGKGSKDKIDNISKNLNIVSKKMGCSSGNLVSLNQIHSDKVYKINSVPKKRLAGDAMITNKQNIAISILTADCAPILIIEKKQKYVGAIHAGWKGAFKGIVKKTIQLLKKNGCSERDMIACIGPCIKKNSYEVKDDFFKLFKNKNEKNVKFFIFKKKKIFFDLSEYIKSQFYENGVKKIDIIRKDTYNLKNNFFSSRRSKKNNHNDYGRNISTIMIK